MTMKLHLFAIVFLFAAFRGVAADDEPASAIQPTHLQGEMVGEVTAESAILQSRLTASELAEDGDLPGKEGVGCFEIAEDAAFQAAQRTPWMKAVAEHDYIIKTKVTGLKAGTKYFYRLVYGSDREQTKTGPTRSFATNPGAKLEATTKLVVVTGMNYAFFHDGLKHDDKRAYHGPDKHLGYPALATILEHRPDFFVATGDNVYYDHHVELSAKTPGQMRKKWHEQFVQPRFVELFSTVPAYWEKDDHDHRYNDCDTAGNKEPPSDLGIAVFKEQVPITDPADAEAVTYRTHRISKDLQIWLLEGRDYRSPNRSPDGPEKTIWGTKQREWLKRTILQSDASFRLIISPTPLIGPDGKGKKDSHVNIGGFRHEGDDFFDWAKLNGLPEKGVFLICGDRHWQYQAIHPSGMHEFSCGALVDANSRMGIDPGTPNSTDPEGLVKQPFTSPKPSGGFLEVTVTPRDGQDESAGIRFDFFDEKGEVLFQVARRR